MTTECMHKRTTQTVMRLGNGAPGELSVCADCGAEVDFRPFRAEDMPTKPIPKNGAKMAAIAPAVNVTGTKSESERPSGKPVNPLEKVREARRALEQARRDLEAAVGDLPLGSLVKTDDLKALFQVVQEARKKLKIAENY